MDGLIDALSALHFTHPWWLAAIPVALILWWRIRLRATRRPDPPEGVAPHLAAALTVGGEETRRLRPIDLVTLTIVLAALAAAGPAWRRIADPLAAQTAPLAIALLVSDSMTTPDVPPTRLDRARHKILDVLAARSGARTALIAYAGAAHRVAPLTEDPEVLKPFLEGLSPDVMPKKGRDATAALALAAESLAAETTPGAILFVLDELDRADLPAFRRHAEAEGSPVTFLAIGADAEALEGLRAVPGASVVETTADGGDVAAVGRRIASAWRDALSRDDRQGWDDRGWALAWPAALLTLLWFRRGWTMRWALVFVALAGAGGGEARADGLADWFLTPDQQGRVAFERKEFAEAAERFDDPMWRGHALYRTGKYDEAAEVFARLPSAAAAFAEGMARLRSRGYRPAIAAFETALERDPDLPGAACNLEIARAVLDHVETAREESDTGEQGRHRRRRRGLRQRGRARRADRDRRRGRRQAGDRRPVDARRRHADG